MAEMAQDILDFWLDEVGPSGWYEVSEALDARITERYGALWEAVQSGEHEHWTCAADTALALIILLDQFPRNMFRGSPQAFASDEKALGLAKTAIERGFDHRIEGPARQFFYLPLMHSERLADQEKCVRLFQLNFGEGETLLHAQAHREVIRRFGRFPYRNAALGRRTTAEEQAWMDGGGYPALVAEMKA